MYILESTIKIYYNRDLYYVSMYLYIIFIYLHLYNALLQNTMLHCVTTEHNKVSEFSYYATALWTLHCRTGCLVGSAQRNGNYFFPKGPIEARVEKWSRRSMRDRWKEREEGEKMLREKASRKERETWRYKSSGDPSSRQELRLREKPPEVTLIIHRKKYI